MRIFEIFNSLNIGSFDFFQDWFFLDSFDMNLLFKNYIIEDDLDFNFINTFNQLQYIIRDSMNMAEIENAYATNILELKKFFNSNFTLYKYLENKVDILYNYREMYIKSIYINSININNPHPITDIKDYPFHRDEIEYYHQICNLEYISDSLSDSLSQSSQFPSHFFTNNSPHILITPERPISQSLSDIYPLTSNLNFPLRRTKSFSDFTFSNHPSFPLDSDSLTYIPRLEDLISLKKRKLN